jgi:hypothetical protein
VVNLGTAKLARVIIGLGILAIAGTNLAFAQNSTPTGTTDYPCAATPFYGAQAYGYIACTPMDTARMEGIGATVAVIALAVGCGAAGAKHHTAP